MTERNGRIVGINFGYTNFYTGEHEFKPWYNEIGAKTYSKVNFKSFDEMVNAVKTNAANNIHINVIKIPKYSPSVVIREINKLATLCEYAVVDTPFDEDKAYREFRLIKEDIVKKPSATTVKKLSKQKMSPKLSKERLSRLVEWRKPI
jgi:hypothetical protein